MHIGIATTDVMAAGANGAAGPAVIVPVVDALATGMEDVDARHNAGHDGGRSPDNPGLNGAGAGGAPLTGAARLRAIMADPAGREALRFRYEETIESMSSIGRDIGVHGDTVSVYCAAAGWTRPPGAPIARRTAAVADPRNSQSAFADVGRVTGRLIGAIDRQISKVETRLKKRNSEIEEKDSRILGHLARTLATLMALDRDGGATAKEPERVDRDELNADLARRIERWARGGDEPA